MKRTRKCTQKNSEDRVVNLLEDLSEFQRFQKEVLPALRKAVADKKPAKEILELVKAHAAARLGTIALTSFDPAVAIQAIEKVFQRTDGPVTQEHKHEHQFHDLPETQLDALLKTKLAKAQGITPPDDGSKH